MTRIADRNKAEIFVEHVRKHLIEMKIKPPNVVCKICNKTLDEIVKEETEKGIWIADDIYKTEIEYMDRNGKRFKIIEVK